MVSVDTYAGVRGASEVIAEVKQRMNAGRSVDLSCELDMLRSPNPTARHL